MVELASNNESSSNSGVDDQGRRNQGRSLVQEPMDLLQMSLNEKVLVKLRHRRELRGKLVAFDDHLNLMLGDASEKVTEDVLDA